MQKGRNLIVFLPPRVSARVKQADLVFFPVNTMQRRRSNPEQLGKSAAFSHHARAALVFFHHLSYAEYDQNTEMRCRPPAGVNLQIFTSCYSH